MQTYDLLMLLVLVCATMFGFWKGMAWQIASLASLVVSYFAALKFSEQLAPTFGDTAPWNRFVAMLAIYIVTSFLIWTSFRLVSGAIDKVRLEAFDKQLGALFGFAKGVLLCVAVTFFAVTLLPPAQGEMIVGSQSGQYIVALLNKADAVVPPEIHQVIDPYLNKVQERLNPGRQAGWPTSAAPQTASQAGGWSLPNWSQVEAQVEKALPNVQNLQLPNTATPSGQAPSGWPQPASQPAAQQFPWSSQGANTNGSAYSSVYGGQSTPANPYSAQRAGSSPY